MSSASATTPESADVTVAIPTRNRSQLLERAIASVLGQSYRDFILLVSDNASDDATPAVVGSFNDERIVYRPLERNIGRVANFNRLIELAETEFVLLLGDDDELHPDHLALTVGALKRRPQVGIAHTSYAIVDMLGNPIFTQHDAERTDGGGLVVYESGTRFLDRSMREGPTICLSSAVFRRAALASGGGLQPEDGEVDDFPLQMRIAMDWDIAYIPRGLAFLRAHEDTDSAALGSFTPNGFRCSRALPDLLHANRRRFLAQAGLPAERTRRLERAAERTYRRDVVAHLSMRATTGDGSIAVLGALAQEIRRLPRLAVDPVTWRFLAGQLGGRRLRDWVRHRRSGPGAEDRADPAHRALQALDRGTVDEHHA